jgi:hypothetical protein
VHSAQDLDRVRPELAVPVECEGAQGAVGKFVVASARVTDSRVPSFDAGLDWGDAGIGAGVVLGLLLLALGGTLAVMHRRQSLRRHAATTG